MAIGNLLNKYIYIYSGFNGTTIHNLWIFHDFSASHLFDDRMVAGTHVGRFSSLAGFRGRPSRTWSRMPSGVSLGAEGCGWHSRSFEHGGI